MDQAVIVTEPSGDVRSMNAVAERLYRCTGAELAGEPVYSLVPAGSIEQARAMHATVLAGGTWTGDFLMSRQDGSTFPALMTVAPMLDETGVVTGILGLSSDLTGLQKAEQTEQAFQALVTSTPDAVFTKSLEGVILTWNRGAERLYGYLAADVIGRHVGLLVPDPSGGEVESLLRIVAAGDVVHGLEAVRLRRDGTTVDVSLNISPIFDGEGEVLSALVIARDLSERRRLEGQLARKTAYDDLTGLPNRALLDDSLARGMTRTLRSGLPVGVIVIDLDRFNLINATHGYIGGDQVLAQVAARLLATVGSGDTVARFSADEFVVVTDATNIREVEELAGRIIEALAAPIDVSGVEVSVSASAGIAVAPPLVPDPDVLLRYAQAAMYDAKGLGGARWRTFDLSREKKWNDRIDLGRELADALTQNQLQVHYQPVVELATGRILGMEALLRWDHPTRGWVPPALFVPLAEDINLIGALDEWVLRRACRDAAALRRSDPLSDGLYVSVNVSARNISDPKLLTRVRDAAEAAGFPLSSLELEVTETGLLTDARTAAQVLRSLREAGVGVALDDFGTGYSSLTYLRKLPISTLKLDREFVQSVAFRGDDLAIAASMVDLGRAVGLRTVAEGIESPEQLTILHRMGCHSGQGYLWSPALPIRELATLLTEQDGFLASTTTRPAEPLGRVRRSTAAPVTNEHGLHRIMRLHGDGASLATIAAALNAEQYRRPTGQRWHLAAVARVIADVAHRSRRNTASVAGGGNPAAAIGRGSVSTT
jgi:diguanylate cyclase (GGDEF)-like protein/PAS domain S-box-containing protein